MSEAIELFDAIYEASAIPDRWPGVLEEIGRGIDAALGSVFVQRAGHDMRWIGTEGATRLFHEFLGHNPPLEPIRFIEAQKIEHDGFYTDLDFKNPSLFEHAVYTEFLYPRNFGWHAVAQFNLPTGEFASVGFERYRDRGPFEPAYIEHLNALRPHLGRAAVLSAQLGLQRAQGMSDALNTVGIPGAVLRPNGSLFVANGRFEKLIPDVVLDRKDRVALTESGADGLLADTIARLGTKNAAGQSRSIPVAARGGRPPMIFHIAPVRGAAQDIFSRSLALLMVTPVDRNSVPSAAVLQVLFDLTPAEARVARGIAQAKTIDVVAMENGVSRETVRTQLAAVLAKTGMNRQAELVALLGGRTISEAGED